MVAGEVPVVMIPLWLPWVVVVALVAAALAGRDSPYRLWAPTAVVAIVAAWLTISHVLVSDDELFEAVNDAAAAVDGTVGGVTQDRLRIEVEDRLGRDVEVKRADGPADSSGDIAYDYQVAIGGDHEMCVKVVEQRIDQGSALGQAGVSVDRGACSSDGE